MKLLTTILPMAAALLLSCADTDSRSNLDTFDITLSGKGCNNLMARLYRDTDSGLAIVDSSRFEMQKGRLRGSLQSPELMFIYIDNAPDYLPVFVENSHIDIEVNTARPSRSVVSGSESNKIFTDFLQSYKAYITKESGNMKMLQSAYSNFDTLMIERLEQERRQIRQETDGLQRQFIQKYIEHPIACYILSAHLMYQMSRDVLRALADSIPPQNRDNIYYKRIVSYLDSPDHDIPDLSAHPARQEYEKISARLRASEGGISARIALAAKLLANRPYVGGTLDESATETVVIDFQRFDCVTYQETCLALAKDAGSSQPSFENFYRHLENLRYRDGHNVGYCSRLHYSTDWLADNALRGNVSILTQDLGGVESPNQIDFMSTHSHLYKHLKDNAAATDSIREREDWLNDHHAYYIPKDQIAAIADRIPSGSLIFITTSAPGLDFAHVGIAVRENGVLKMYHASSTDHKTTVTPTPLAQYLAGIKKFTGIAVAVPR